ncbi:MAG: hypothetical protein JRJ21_00735 [Deltaproteobacteria bacterium]|nr:hypothetical protein [Deltaproteobacteria bacterium]
MNHKNRKKERGAIEIIEQAIHLLRLSPFSLLFSYYMGSLPFVLGLLYFWADMGRNAFASKYCAVASFGLAMLFVWMKCWHGVFAQNIIAHMAGEPTPRRSLGRIGRLTATQTIIQASGLFVLPLALVMAIPFAWSYALYQNVSAQGDGDGHDIKTVLKSSWQQAKLQPGQNHILLLIFSMFGFFVFLNLAIGIFLVPQMLKKFLGIETVFTISGWSMLNTTFLATTFGIAYLCMDPLVKTVYAIRCFYGASLRTGKDLKTELKAFTLSKTMFAAMLSLTLLATSFCPLMAGERPGISSTPYGLQNTSVPPDALSGSIDEVMSRREFAWRMPREKIEQDSSAQPGPIATLMKWIAQGAKTCFTTIARWLGKIMDWLEKFLPGTDKSREGQGKGWITSVRGLLWVLLVVLVSFLGVFLWRTLKRRKERQSATTGEAIPAVPDLTDDHIKADELPADQWMVMAKELMDRGEFRLALRALYLSTLAHLAENEIITIAKYKSNRDYKQELGRRGHEREDLLAVFSENVTVFDRSWYGMHKVTRNDLEHFSENQERIMSFVG